MISTLFKSCNTVLNSTMLLVRVFYNTLQTKDIYITEDTSPSVFYESLHHMGINRGFFHTDWKPSHMIRIARDLATTNLG